MAICLRFYVLEGSSHIKPFWSVKVVQSDEPTNPEVRMWRKVVPKGLLSFLHLIQKLIHYVLRVWPSTIRLHRIPRGAIVFSITMRSSYLLKHNEPCCSLSHCTLRFSSMKYVYTLRRSSTSTFSAFRLRETICTQDLKLSAYRSVVEPAIEVSTFSASGVSVTSSSSHLKV